MAESLTAVWIVVSMILAVIILYIKWIKPMRVAKRKCYVCSYPIGKDRRVLADGEDYHYDCWLKLYKRELLD